MKIIVLVKDVPDTWGERTLIHETGLTSRTSTERVLDEINERAVELAVSFAESSADVEVIALSMAPEDATASVRKALAIGADRAVQISDDNLLGADFSLTVETLAAAIENIGFDLIIAGDQSTDGSAGLIAAGLAERLNIPQLTRLDDPKITQKTVCGTRRDDLVSTELEAVLPAIISVTERLPDARFPNFKAIVAAKRKSHEFIGLEQTSSEIDILGQPRSIMTAVSPKPPRATGVKIMDEGDAGKQIADYLKFNGLA